MDEIAGELAPRKRGVTGDEVLEQISLVEKASEEMRHRPVAERRS